MMDMLGSRGGATTATSVWEDLGVTFGEEA